MGKLALAVLGLALVLLAAEARADVLDVYTRLAERDLRPAPLVLTRVPPSLAPLDRTIEAFGTRRGYGLRLQASGPDAVIVLAGGETRSLAAQLADSRVFGYPARKTRVRGRRAYAITTPRERVLLWSEAGRVYRIGTGTPRTVSAARLRATATGLDRLESAFSGSAGHPDNPSEAFAVATARTITARVDWSAQCASGTPRAGSAAVTLIPRRGNGFAFDIAAEGWTGSVSGTIGASVTVDLRATGTFDGDACDTGPVRITLAPRR